MPTQTVLDYYNQKLIGRDGLSGILSAIKISDEIDEFIALGPNEICKHSLYSQAYDIVNKIRGKVFSQKDDGYIRLRTKFVCAYIYQILYEIEKCQDDIEAHRPLSTDYFGHVSPFDMSYREVPIEYYKKMRSVLDSSHSKFESFKSMNIDNEFRESILRKVTNAISNYWSIFGLDYTPISQKIEDKAISYGVLVFLSAIGFLIFFLIGYAATH